jgi:phosphomevalonate kinase
LADDDYYSHSRSRIPGTFTRFGVAIRDAHKTGLGSSAALVTALVSGLLTFFTPDIPQPYTADHQSTIHNLAQAAHCAAQGKVGSGFDVAAATYGSCLYRRFTPSILEKVGDSSSPGFGERLYQCVADLESDLRWDVDILHQAVKIPQSLLLLMCDVDCGSATPGMVKRVLAWRKEKPVEANLIWAALQQGTDDLCCELGRLYELEGISFNHNELGDIILTIRSLVREMSVKSGVPIEPPVITELLDYCTSLPGVVGGVAPGAGGYDAVALLVKNDTEIVRDLQSRLEGWKSEVKSNSGPTIGRVSLLQVRQEKEGVKQEDPSRYKDWT